jgi:translation initiation factor 2 beta subunit (eIF-2beta)/eIF-5
LNIIREDENDFVNVGEDLACILERDKHFLKYFKKIFMSEIYNGHKEFMGQPVHDEATDI